MANVARAVALCPDPRHARRLKGGRLRLADVGAVPAPTASLETLLAAAADVYGVSPWDLAGTSRARVLVLGRILYGRLGRLESYSLEQLGAAIGRKRSWMCQLAIAPLPDAERALAIARTLLRDPDTRRWLPRRRVG
jgi:hypothetical protein